MQRGMLHEKQTNTAIFFKTAARSREFVRIFWKCIYLSLAALCFLNDLNSTLEMAKYSSGITGVTLVFAGMHIDVV